MRLQIGRKDTTSLMDHLWNQYNRNSTIFVACVPLRPPSSATTANTIIPAVDIPASESSPLASSKAPVKSKSSKRSDTVKLPHGDTTNDDFKDNFEPSDLFDLGVAARIVNLVKHNRNEVNLKNSKVYYVVTLEGVCRLKISHIVRSLPFLEASVETIIEKGL